MQIKNTPRINQNKKELWERILKEWGDSGLSKTLFCKGRRIAISSFWRWHKLLTNDLQEKNDKISFVPVKLKKSDIMRDSSLCLLLKNDIKAFIPDNINKSTLKIFLELLGVLPC